jgi:hypothetical protein
VRNAKRPEKRIPPRNNLTVSHATLRPLLFYVSYKSSPNDGGSFPIFASLKPTILMKYISLIAAFALLAFNANAQVLFEENFDGCALPTDWSTNMITGVDDWQFSDNTGANVDGTCMAYFDDDVIGDLASVSLVELESPTIDLSGVSAAEMTLDYVFEDLGLSSFQILLWNGTTWDTAFTEVSDPGCFGWSPACAPRMALVNVSNYLSADFKFKLVYDDGADWSWYIGVDNIQIIAPPTAEAELTSIDEPLDGCGLTLIDVILSITNNGSDTITSIDGSYNINSLGAVSETFTVSIPFGETAQVTFLTQFDASAIGAYNVDAWTTLLNDTVLTNDSLSGSFTNIPVVSALPYFEDFESGAGGWLTGGTLSSWELGLPTGEFIDTAYSGVNSWVTDLDANYVDGELSFIESPCFDFSSLLIDPVFRFAQIFNTEGCCDEGYVDVSIDAGVTWTRLGLEGEGTNWYNDAFANEWDGDSGIPGEWRIATHLLDSTAGEGSVKIRIGFSSDGSINFEGFGVDDIEIFEQPPINAGVVEILSPITGCGLGNEMVTVVIENFGDVALVDYPVGYDAGAGSVIETVTDTLHIADTDTFTFATLADLSATMAYDFSAWTEVVGDGDLLNDSLFTVVTSAPIISSLPYEEDFESGPGGWYAEMEGEEGIWEFGDPEGLVIDTANSGVNAWASNLNTDNYPNAMLSYLYSPCFDLSTLTIDPILEFSIIFDGEFNYDAAWVEVSTDAGANWELVGNVGEGVNWFTNNNFFNANIDQAWAGQSNGDITWIDTEHLLDGTAGSSDVIIRFAFSSDGSVNFFEGTAIDDISLTEQPQINGELVSINDPLSGCGLSDTMDISVTIANGGFVPMDSVVLSYILDGGITITQVWNDTIAPGDSATYTFGQTVDLSVPGDYELTTIITIIGDGDLEDDTVTVLIQNIPIVDSFPYSIDFESGTGGWASNGGVNGNWELGDPEGVIIDSAYSGVNAWATNLNALNYENGQFSTLTSPCLDFSSFIDDPVLNFAAIFNSEAGWDGFYVESTVDGGVTWNLVGTMGQGLNWYTNNAFNNFNIVEGFDGTSTDSTWVIAESVVGGTAGSGSVRIRFAFSSDGSVNFFEGAAVDDISIFAQPQFELAAIAMEDPESGCSLGEEIVRIKYLNRGTQAASSYELGYIYNGNTVTETAGIQLFQGDTATYAFATPVDLSAVGDHQITVFTALANDENLSNDTLMGDVVTNVQTTPPFQSEITNIPIVGGEGPAVSDLIFCGLPNGLDDCFQIEYVRIDDINHSWIGDLDITLVSPSGQELILSSGNGCCVGGSILDVTFADGTNNDITLQANGILPGLYNPEGAGGFASFQTGQNPNGTWQLVVEDPFTGDVGTVTGWSMGFTENSPEPTLSLDDTDICINHVIELSASAGMDSYLWNSGDNGETIVLDASDLGVGDHDFSVTVDQNGCTGYSDTITITVNECVGIEETNGASINMYPNPTSGQFTLDIEGASEAMQLSILESTGRVVYTDVLSGGTTKHTMDLSHLAAGVYNVQLIVGETSITEKLFVR